MIVGAGLGRADGVDVRPRVDRRVCGVGRPVDDGVRSDAERDQRHAEVTSDSTGLLVRGAYDDRKRMREAARGAGGDSENRLVEWARKHDREPGDAVDLDEVDPGYLYGLRVPGERAVYTVTKRPDRGLQDIADSLYDE